MKRIVLDTNVLVSGLLIAENPPGRIVDALRVGHIRLVVDDRILGEYGDVLSRPYFEKYIPSDERDWILDYLYRDSDPVESICRFDDLPDPKDACFLEVAHTGAVILVTGNLKHFPAKRRRGVGVLSPADYCRRFLAD